MDINQLFDFVHYLFMGHKLIGVAVLVIVFIFLIKKTVATLKIALLIALLVAGFYLVSQLGNASFHGLIQEQHGVSEMNKAINNETR